MTTPQVLFGVFLALALLGVATLSGIGVYWRSLGRHVSDWWAKVAAKVVQLPVLLVSGYATYAAARRDEWFPVAVAGAVCIAFWEVASLLVDSRVKAVEKEDKKTLAALEQEHARRLAALERECERRTELLSAFREGVAEKVRRLMNAVPRRKANSGLAFVAKALQPEQRLEDLLQSLAVYFVAQLPDEEAQIRNFRAGLYVKRGESMTPILGVNLRNPSYNVFTSFNAHAAAFRLDAGDESRAHVVTCARTRQTVIVEDCVAAAGVGEFKFFNADQRGYLRSMLTYHLDEVCLSDGTMVVAVLAIDTDSPGFFRESDRNWLEFCLHEFGTRVKLESLLAALLAERGRRDERDSQKGEAEGEALREAARGAPEDHAPGRGEDAGDRPHASPD
ncbi:MAG: hypothetical protein K2V38_06450 [Gemmataceae bacterium]|nr:hypothetical protein [Gemmataceae bacterium]